MKNIHAALTAHECGTGAIRIPAVQVRPDSFHPDAYASEPGLKSDLHLLSRLALLLHEGALHPRRWTEFLELAARRLRANAVSLVLREPTSADPGLVYSWGGAPEGQSDHILEIDLQNPTQFHVRLRIRRVRRTGDFSAADRRFCELLAPHVRVAIQTHAKFDLMRCERAVYAEAMDRLTIATILLDEAGRVVHTNELARRLLAQRSGISLVGDALVFSHHEDARRFRDAVAHALEAGRSARPGTPEVMRCRRPSGAGYVGMIVRPSAPRLEQDGARMTSCVAVFLDTRFEVRGSSAASIEKLFGFTRKEALLALCLANGKTMHEATVELGVTLSTARTHLRAIYSKTGIDRQAKLVRIILRSVAVLGQSGPPVGRKTTHDAVSQGKLQSMQDITCIST